MTDHQPSQHSVVSTLATIVPHTSCGDDSAHVEASGSGGSSTAVDLVVFSPPGGSHAVDYPSTREQEQCRRCAAGKRQGSQHGPHTCGKPTRKRSATAAPIKRSQRSRGAGLPALTYTAHPEESLDNPDESPDKDERASPPPTQSSDQLPALREPAASAQPPQIACTAPTEESLDKNGRESPPPPPSAMVLGESNEAFAFAVRCGE